MTNTNYSINKKWHPLLKRIFSTFDKLPVYLVGGAVRDFLMDKLPKDYDFVAQCAKDDLIRAGFEQIDPSSHIMIFVKRVKIPGLGEYQFEVALPRKEIKVDKGYHGFKLIFDPNMSIEEDLKRRDLTVNAIALDRNGTIIDPFGGRKDIKNKVLRHVSEHFLEDPLRIVRLYRFTAKGKEWHISDETIQFLKKHQDYLEQELSITPKERIFKEIEKALMEPETHKFFEAIKQIKIGKIFKEIYDIDKIPNMKGDPLTKFALLGYYFKNEEDLHNFLVRFKFPVKYRQASMCVKRYMNEYIRQTGSIEYRMRLIKSISLYLPVMKSVAKQLGYSLPNPLIEKFALIPASKIMDTSFIKVAGNPQEYVMQKRIEAYISAEKGLDINI